MAAEKAASLKAALGPMNLEHPIQSDFDEKGPVEQGLEPRRETIQFFAASQDGVPGRKGVWRRRTLEFEKFTR